MPCSDLRESINRIFLNDGPAIDLILIHPLVLKLRAGLTDEGPLTLGEIGKRLDLSKERVWQIHEAAVQKVKGAKI